MFTSQDTVCALASAVGKGGVSIIRVSGPLAFTLCQSLTGLIAKPREVQVCKFHTASGDIIDLGLTLAFKAPLSFTGEDVCEFHCHGSPVVVDQILQQLTTDGARLAMPGEFSARAFLNNKLDLAQAEAIADLIDSSTVLSARHAVRSLQGDFSKLIHSLVEDVIALRVYVEASIDFSDEEIDFLGHGKIQERLAALLARLSLILAQAKTGTIVKEGLRVVIAGAPNVGKSTLLNALCGSDVAIVTPIAGTTRDMLHHEINLDGIPIHVTDTAGLRQSNDPVETEGIRRAKQALVEADHVLLLIDAKNKDDYQSREPWQELSSICLPKMTAVFNKIDLYGMQPCFVEGSNTDSIYLSAATGAGLDFLKDHLKKSAGLGSGGDGGFIARRRHLVALSAARTALLAAQDCLTRLNAIELVAEDLRKTQQALDEITGKFSSDDLLGAIFGSFCVGK